MIRRPLHRSYYTVIDQKTGLSAAELTTARVTSQGTCKAYNARTNCIRDPRGKLIPRFRVARFAWVPDRRTKKSG